MKRKTLPNGVFRMEKQTEADFDVFASAWLHSVPTEIVRLIHPISEIIEYKNKDTIYALGGPQEYLWGVVGGRVNVLVAMSEMDPVLGHVHHPGAWFGESEVIHGIDGLVEMKAVGVTRVARLPYAAFRKHANSHPSLWEAFARLTSMNQLLAMSAANDLALRTSRQRLAATLLRLSGKRGVLQGSRPADTVRASQQDIATLANVSASKASAHLGTMANEGLIRLEYAQVAILDEAKLLEVIEG